MRYSACYWWPVHCSCPDAAMDSWAGFRAVFGGASPWQWPRPPRLPRPAVRIVPGQRTSSFGLRRKSNKHKVERDANMGREKELGRKSMFSIPVFALVECWCYNNASLYSHAQVSEVMRTNSYLHHLRRHIVELIRLSRDTSYWLKGGFQPIATVCQVSTFGREAIGDSPSCLWSVLLQVHNFFQQWLQTPPLLMDTHYNGTCISQ